MGRSRRADGAIGPMAAKKKAKSKAARKPAAKKKAAAAAGSPAPTAKGKAKDAGAEEVERLRAALAAGIASQQVQTSPHVVLLDEELYEQKARRAGSHGRVHHWQ